MDIWNIKVILSLMLFWNLQDKKWLLVLIFTHKFQKQLSSILEYVELLNEIDISKVEPTAQTTGLKNVYREDKPQKGEGLTQTETLKNAPEKQDGHIKAKAVLWRNFQWSMTNFQWIFNVSIFKCLKIG